MAPKARRGQAMDAKKLSAMIGLLKYQANKGSGDRQEAAVVALDIYQSLGTSDSKAGFLKEFEQAGGGKTTASLKFAASFKKTISHSKTNEIASVEDFYTRLI